MADRLDRRRLPWQGSFGSDNRRSVDFPRGLIRGEPPPAGCGTYPAGAPAAGYFAAFFLRSAFLRTAQ